MKKLLLVFNLCLILLASRAQNPKKTIVLVHGAFGYGSAWYQVIPLLKAKGMRLLQSPCPGHGADTTSYASLAMASYAHSVEKLSVNGKT